MRKKRYVIISKFRFTIFLILTILALTTIINILFPNNFSYGYKEKEVYELVHISQGDTLWNIAKNYNNRNIDIRELIFDIEMINDISNANIHPGDIIKIPIN